MKTRERKIKTALTYILLIGVSLVMALPFWVMLVTSLMTQAQTFQASLSLWPQPIRWENYTDVFMLVPMGRYFLNSLLVAVVTTLGQLAFSATAAYGFSRLMFPGKNALFLLVLVTMMIPPQVNMVPLFLVMKQLHAVDTYLGLILPGVIGAFGIFLLRQWFNAMPKALEEAAALDGCNPWQTFWHVALPLARPALITLALFTFIGSWNSLLWPLIITQSDTLRTLPLGIASLKSSFRDITDWGILMAASTIAVLPVVALFIAGQKQFIRGLLQGSVKE